MTRDITQWVSVRDTAHALGISRQRVYKLIQLGKVRVERTRVGMLVDPESSSMVSQARARRSRQIAAREAVA